MAETGKKVKNFKLPATGDKEISLNDFKGKNVVLYFYPKDSTHRVAPPKDRTFVMPRPGLHARIR